MSKSPFQDILDLKQQLRDKLRNEGKDILKGELNKFLEKHPEVHTLLWAQSDNVYNDEGYSFRIFGIDLLVQTDLPWAQSFYDLLQDEWSYGSRNKSIENREHFHGETISTLREVIANNDEYKDTINLLIQDFKNLERSIPEEIFQVFGNVAVRVTREGIFMADYEYQH